MFVSVTRLGLIGDNIARSRSPRLHVEAGRLCGMDVTYERLIPRDMNMDFSSVFERCAGEGFAGINITYPYKEEVVARVHVPDPATAMIRACNTVVFGEGIPEGHNTDCTGFASAFRARFGNVAPGKVAMAGAGGVGKAVAFALARLGASELRIFDRDVAKAKGLADALGAANTGMRVIAVASIEEATSDADGLINSTPLGMVGYPGTAIEAALIDGASWAFDAVYTPVDTQFLRDAADRDVETISGYELFFHQGVDAFAIFTGRQVDAAALRAALASEEAVRA
jgi:shikimate dehydrogenase